MKANNPTMYRFGRFGRIAFGLFCLSTFRILAQAEYPDAIWVSTPTENFENANRSATDVRWIVLHTTEGTTASAIQRFQNPTEEVSTHYIISRDGSVIQMVRNEDVAFTAGNLAYNRRSINIEHERYGSNNWTSEQYAASVKLIKWLTEHYNVSISFPAGIAPSDPTVGSGIIGHAQVPDPANPSVGGGASHHTDPANWSWAQFRSLFETSPEEKPILVYWNGQVLDGINGQGVGNSDGEVNPGEEIDLNVDLRNRGSATATSVRAVLESSDEYVIITDSSELFGTIAAGAIDTASDFDFTVSGTAPAGHIIDFTLKVSSDQGAATQRFSLIVHPPNDPPSLQYHDSKVFDGTADQGFGNANGVINPGEEIDLSVNVSNEGGVTATSVQGILSSSDPYVTITDSSVNFGTIIAGGIDTGSDFDFTVSPSTPVGHIIAFSLKLTSDQTLPVNRGFALLVAQKRKADNPIIQPAGGTFNNAVTVMLETTIPNASILYTSDGNDPTEGAKIYEAPFLLSESATIKAKVTAEGFTDSDIVSKDFQVVQTILSLSVMEVVNGTLRLQLLGRLPGKSYVLETSEDLRAWNRANVSVNGDAIQVELSGGALFFRAKEN